jgi:hypothetical protein
VTAAHGLEALLPARLVCLSLNASRQYSSDPAIALKVRPVNVTDYADPSKSMGVISTWGD